MKTICTVILNEVKNLPNERNKKEMFRLRFAPLNMTGEMRNNKEQL